MATQPAYVRIAGEIARRIRSGELLPGAQLPSLVELAERHGVSDIVIRQAVGLLRSQGLVRGVERRGVFVAELPNLIRVSPERQLETAETSFSNESGEVDIERETHRLAAPEEIAHALGLAAGADVTHVVTRIAVDATPVTISDSYERTDLTPAEDSSSTPRTLEETLAIRPPTEDHAAYLGLAATGLAITIRQQFRSGDRVDMVADITYPIDRYAAFVFRMPLPAREPDDAGGPELA